MGGVLAAHHITKWRTTMENVSTENVTQYPAKNESSPPITAAQRSTARHEAGHTVLAEILSVPLESVSILPSVGATGHTQLAKKVQTVNLATMPATKRIDFATRLCVVCLGGAASLNVIENRPDWPSAEEDLSVYDSLVPYASTPEEGERTFFFRIFARATVLIEQHQAEVEAVADALIRRKTLSAREVREILHQTRQKGVDRV